MKLLLDQNLSRKLVGRLGALYPDSTHAVFGSLVEATDREVWDFAAMHGYVIVSKDSDFRQLAFFHGPPPKLVWLRLGKVSTAVDGRKVGRNERVPARGEQVGCPEAVLASPTLSS